MSKFIALLCAVSMTVGATATFAAETEETTTETTAVEAVAEETVETAADATEAVTEEATEVAEEATEAAEEATEAATEATEAATEAASEEVTEEATEVAEEATEEATVVPTFVDVPEDAYYAEAVAYCAEKGLFNGTSDDEFSPSITMTRGMFATVFGRLQNADLTNVELTYADVKADAYYAPYIAWATEQGIMDGYSDDEFGPDDAITREQAAKMLYAYATKVANVTLTEAAAEYADSANVSDWAAEAVAANAAIGYLLADADNNINPTAELTRADACYAVAATVKLAEAAVAEDVVEETVTDETATEEAATEEAATEETVTEETVEETTEEAVETVETEETVDPEATEDVVEEEADVIE